MSKLVSIFPVVLLSTLVVACNSQGTTAQSKDAPMEQNTSTVDPAKVNESIVETKAALDDAIKNGYAWRDTGKILDKAKKLSDDGDAAKAQQLAMKASEQIELAHQQSMEQKDAHPWLFN